MKKTIYADTQHDPIKTLISLAGSSKTRKLMKSVTIQSRDKHVTALCEILWDDQSQKGRAVFDKKNKKGFLNWLVRSIGEDCGKDIGAVGGFSTGLLLALLLSAGYNRDIVKQIREEISLDESGNPKYLTTEENSRLFKALLLILLSSVSGTLVGANYGAYKGNKMLKNLFTEERKLVQLIRRTCRKGTKQPSKTHKKKKKE